MKIVSSALSFPSICLLSNHSALFLFKTKQNPHMSVCLCLFKNPYQVTYVRRAFCQKPVNIGIPTPHLKIFISGRLQKNRAHHLMFFSALCSLSNNLAFYLFKIRKFRAMSVSVSFCSKTYIATYDVRRAPSCPKSVNIET